MTRLTQLNNDDYRYLTDDDQCFYYGEYTSGGGFGASDTNQQILNLKNRPTSPEARLYYKTRAVEYWARKIAGALDLPAVAQSATFVPMPCSKPIGHPDYDDRMLRVLNGLLRFTPGLDIRPLLLQTVLRNSQHEGGRLSPAQLRETMAVDQLQLDRPLKTHIVILDDVITMGASFNAARGLIDSISGESSVIGIFLAKTVWPPSELDDFINLLG